MEERPRPDGKELFPEEANLMSLLELQKFLAEELSEGEPGAHYGKAFQPLTEGLGFTAPVKKAQPTPPPLPSKEEPKAAPAPSRPLSPSVSRLFEEEQARPAPPVKEGRPRVEPQVLFADRPLPEPFRELDLPPPPVEAPVEEQAMEPIVQPPPVPQVSFVRRMLSALADHLFVGVVLMGVLLITSGVMAKEGGVLSRGLWANLQHPVYLRFAVLGFVTLWMGYLAVGVALLDMTFGMWVWGIRIGYGEGSTDSRFARKLMRVLMSFFLESLVFLSPLLLIRVKGRNLVDLASGSYLYRTG